MNGRHSQIKVPEQWPDHYTADDREAVVRIHTWLADNASGGWTQSQLSRRSSVNTGTLNQILQGKYGSPPAKHLKACLEVMELHQDRQRDNVADTPYVHTSVHRAVWAACKRARMYGSFAVISAYVGTGKTRAVTEYAAAHSNVVLIEATPGLAAWGLLDMLVEELRVVVPKSRNASQGTKDNMFKAVISSLKGTDTLLIIDEAETLTESSLEYVRRIRDKAKVGVVLSGTEKLYPMVRNPRGRFGQISSRVLFWPPVIESITEADAGTLARAGFEGDGVELDADVLDALWQVCDGSARVLCEAIIPGVRDYGLRKGLSLTPELIYKVGTDILGFRTKRRA